MTLEVNWRYMYTLNFFEAGVRKTTYSVQMEIKHSKCLRRQIFFWHFLVDSCI